MVKAMGCGIVVREFVLQSRYYIHFRANTLLEEQKRYYLTHCWEDKRYHTFPMSIWPESERNSATGVLTRLLRFHSPAF